MRPYKSMSWARIGVLLNDYHAKMEAAQAVDLWIANFYKRRINDLDAEISARQSPVNRRVH